MNTSKALKTALCSAPRAGLTAFLALLLLSFLGAPTYAQKIAGGEGTYASTAIAQDGTLYTWGYDNYNHAVVASGSKIAQDSTPVVVAFPSGVTAWTDVAEGLGFTLAIGNDGNLYSWGYNNYGQLGDSSKVNSNTPVMVVKPSGVTGWKAVAAGDAMSLAIGSDDNLYAWGYNNFGQLGNGSTATDSIPVKVSLPVGVTAESVSAAANSAMALGSNDSLYSWGRNANGQLGIGSTSDQKIPVAVHLPTGITATVPISGAFFNGAICSDGNIYAWGSNGNGQLGDGTTTQRTSPVMVIKPSSVSSWRAAACGASFVFAIADNDSLYAWGYNGTGELGVATGSTNNTSALNVALPAGILPSGIAAGHNHGFVIGSDGQVYSWGRNNEAELGINSTTNSGTSSSTTIHNVDGVGATGYLALGIPPAIPTLASPVNGATNQPVSITLRWNTVIGAVSYKCQISTDSTFTSNLVANNSSVVDTMLNVPGLSNSTIYYWRVRSNASVLFSGYSTVDSFKTVVGPPPMPTIVAPANNAIDLPNIDTLVCNNVPGASQYNWQISTAADFSTFFLDDSTSDTMKVVTGLMPGTKYYWQVRSINPGGGSGFAGPDSFTVMAAPVAPILAFPGNNASFIRADTLTLMWHSVAGASGYSFQVSDTVSFARLVASSDSVKGNADTSYAVTSLRNLTKYYWRVRSYNSGGFGVFSGADSFMTRISVPAKPTLVSPGVSSTGVPRMTTFVWQPSPLATTYHFQLANNLKVYTSGDSVGQFLAQNVLFDTTLTDTTLRLSFALDATSKYYWQVAGVDTAGAGTFAVGVFTTGIGILGVEDGSGVPTVFALMQNYPNPFNPSTIIRYDVPKNSDVTIRVYDILGREVATLVNARQAPGKYSVEFNASRFASGVYFVRMSAGAYSKIQKMMLVK